MTHGHLTLSIFLVLDKKKPTYILFQEKIITSGACDVTLRRKYIMTTSYSNIRTQITCIVTFVEREREREREREIVRFSFSKQKGRQETGKQIY